MARNYSIRGLIVFVLIAALGIGWFTNAREKERFKSQLKQIRALKQQLSSERNQLASCETEMQHFSRLANAQIDSIDVTLDAQRRRALTSHRLAEIQFEIDQILDLPEDSESSRRHLELLTSDISQCRKRLENLESNPGSSDLQIARAGDQLAYFESLAKQVAK